jgi:hypothetical protein
MGAFDQDVLKLIRRGTKNTADIVTLLGVDSVEAGSRIALLVRKGLVKQDTVDSRILSLTVKAYNEFQPATLELSTEKKATRAAMRLAPINTTLQQPPANHAPQEPVVQSQQKVDLMELLAKGAQKPQAPAIQPTAENVSKPSPNLETDVKRNNQPVDSCELCKEEFRLSVGSGSNAKYGHCFCGAAYHKDCYEGILGADGRCVRCGRKLDLVMQKETRDEMKKIKSVFED